MMRALIIPVFVTAMAMIISSCGNKTGENTNTEKTDSVNTAVKPVAKDTTSGIYEKKFRNGQVSIRGEMRNGKREGTWFSYYENGQLWSQGEYSNGLRNGKSISWYPDGKVRFEGTYTDDKQTGTWKYYNESGKLEKEINYDQPNGQ